MVLLQHGCLLAIFFLRQSLWLKAQKTKKKGVKTGKS
jgi:hypothetical protein